MKTIVTHIGPDLDAITSVWLIHRFKKGWSKAHVQFVPAGETLDFKHPDSLSSVIHVDTGMGMFDHHQSSETTCAASLVLENLLKTEDIHERYTEALARLVEVVRSFDNFEEALLDDADDDRYQFMLADVLFGLKATGLENEDVLEVGEKLLDSVLLVMRQKVAAEKDIQDGYTFTSLWGKTLAVESKNSQIAHVALRQDTDLIIWRRPMMDRYTHINKGFIRIKQKPQSKKSLQPLYEKLVKKDPKATWFYHAPGNMIINGSAYTPDAVASHLSLRKVVELVKDNQKE